MFFRLPSRSSRHSTGPGPIAPRHAPRPHTGHHYTTAGSTLPGSAAALQYGTICGCCWTVVRQPAHRNDDSALAAPLVDGVMAGNHVLVPGDGRKHPGFAHHGWRAAGVPDLDRDDFASLQQPSQEDAPLPARSELVLDAVANRPIRGGLSGAHSFRYECVVHRTAPRVSRSHGCSAARPDPETSPLRDPQRGTIEKRPSSRKGVVARGQNEPRWLGSHMTLPSDDGLSVVPDRRPGSSNLGGLQVQCGVETRPPPNAHPEACGCGSTRSRASVGPRGCDEPGPPCTP